METEMTSFNQSKGSGSERGVHELDPTLWTRKLQSALSVSTHRGHSRVEWKWIGIRLEKSHSISLYFYLWSSWTIHSVFSNTVGDSGFYLPNCQTSSPSSLEINNSSFQHPVAQHSYCMSFLKVQRIRYSRSSCLSKFGDKWQPLNCSTPFDAAV